MPPTSQRKHFEVPFAARSLLHEDLLPAVGLQWPQPCRHRCSLDTAGAPCCEWGRKELSEAGEVGAVWEANSSRGEFFPEALAFTLLDESNEFST